MLVYSHIFKVHRYPQCIDLYNARLSVTYATPRFISLSVFIPQYNNSFLYSVLGPNPCTQGQSYGFVVTRVTNLQLFTGFNNVIGEIHKDDHYDELYPHRLTRTLT